MVTRLERYKQIADILMKYDFGMLLLEDLSPGFRKLRLERKLHPDIASLSTYERVRMAIEELGPTFVKFGQILSTRREMLPPEFYAELRKLQDKVAPVPFDQIKPIIEEYCGPIEDTFSFLETQPFASASLSQVYLGILKDGTLVAVKVQRPGIKEIIEVDLPILEKLTQRVERIVPSTRVYNPSGMIKDFSVQIMRELDFTRDGKNADILAANFKENDRIKIPRVYWEHSGRRVLIMDYIEGTRIDNVEVIRSMGVDPKEIAEIGFEAYLRQIFADGFFHADPHPGNLLVTRKGELAFLDFGMFGIIRPERRDIFLRTLFSIVEIDIDDLLRSLDKLGITIRAEDVEPLKDELYYSLMNAQYVELNAVDFGGVMSSLPEVLRQYNIVVPESLMSVLKVLWMIFDVGKTLDPEFNFNERVEPYLGEIIAEHFISTDILKKAPLLLMDIAEGLIALPRAINTTLTQIGSGDFKLDIAADDLQQLSFTVDRASDKILMGLVTAAIVVGSSFVVLAVDYDIPYWVFYLALVGYIGALAVGMYAVYEILFKERR
jgi:ubiquinone biosynthesis protein